MMGGWTIWPWAEDNQGLLSLVALVVALFFAVWENRRANRATIETRHGFLDTLIELADEGLAAINLMYEWPDSVEPPLPVDRARAWRDRAQTAMMAVGALMNAPPAHAPTIMEGRRLQEALAPPDPVAWMGVTNIALHTVDPYRDRVRAARGRLAALRSK